MISAGAPSVHPAGKDAPAAPTAPARLALDTLAEAGARPGVSGPAVDPRSLETGIVHLGVGAFHRAHQAVYTEDAAAATGESGWGIMGVTGRSRRVVDQLRPQDGLYSVLTRSEGSQSLRIIGSMRAVASPAEDAGTVLAALARPATEIVSLTITEKGYPRTSTGELDLANAGIAADVAALRAELASQHDAGPSRTVIGLLARGLGRRFSASGQPLTVLPCDNLAANGKLTRKLVSSFAAAAGASALQSWLEDSVAFPSTMVDRIVPATTEADRALAGRLLGVDDRGLVVAEPFGQWVIEDSFASCRPAWERAGATLTSDVEPYEVAKLRMLNATHSLLAYLGALRGFATIAEAVADPELAQYARLLQSQDVRPTLRTPPGMDLADYGESILTRFANPALGHTTVQVAMDGSQKLPIRVLGTVADRLRSGAIPDMAALVVAAWIVFVYRGHDVHGRPLPLDDPAADTLHRAAVGSERTLTDRMLALSGIFPDEIAQNTGFRNAVAGHVDMLLMQVP